MPLTAQQIIDLRADMGDVGEAFSDPELMRLYNRVSGATDDTQRLEAVKALMFEQLLNNAAKLHDYTAGATQEKLSQIVSNLERRFAYYKSALEAARGQKKDMAVAALRAYPHPTRTVPAESELDEEATSNL